MGDRKTGTNSCPWNAANVRPRSRLHSSSQGSISSSPLTEHINLNNYQYVYYTELDEPYTDADEDRLKSFWDTRVEVDPCCDVILGEPLEITVWFRTDGNFTESAALYVDLPRECIERDRDLPTVLNVQNHVPIVKYPTTNRILC